MAAFTMGWKLEPASPLAYAEEDAWFFPEGDENIDISQTNDFASLTKKEIAQQLLEDIDSLVNNDEKDTFSHWVEETIDLPIFEEIQPALPTEEHANGALNKADLTPPYSPGDGNTDSYIILEQCYESGNAVSFSDESAVDFDYQTVLSLVASQEDYALVPQGRCSGSQPDARFPTAPPTPVPDLEKEMAVVDEVVRKTAQSLENNIDNVVWESEISNSQMSSSESVNSFEGGVEDESDDPEWMPLAKKATGKAASPRKRSRPYDREKSQEDRWLRKKEQNKNAATRYRQKKKAEVSEILEEERMLEEKRGKLKQRLSDVQMEIKYLKGLMRDLFKAKDLLAN